MIARLACVCLSFVVLFWTLTASLCADVLYLKDGAPVFGRFVRNTDSHVFFNQRVGDDQYRERTFSKSEVETWAITIDPQRLESLDPGKPEDYRDYAEELSAAADDPESQDMAMRLYLLAAYHGRGPVRQSGLRGMVRVASDAQQEKKCRALAFQLTGNESASWAR